MTALTVTARGQATFAKNVLPLLGIPWERIESEKLPDGRVGLRPRGLQGKLTAFPALLAVKTKKVARSISNFIPTGGVFLPSGPTPC
jgi:hypothetical protein